MNNLSLKAILYGVLADVVGSLAFGMVFGGILGILWAKSGRSPAEIQAMADALNNPAKGGLMAMIVAVSGLAFTWLGGYVAGRVAETDEVKHAGIVGVVGMVLTFVFASAQSPRWWTLVLALLVLPAAIAGGARAAKKKSEATAA